MVVEFGTNCLNSAVTSARDTLCVGEVTGCAATVVVDCCAVSALKLFLAL